MKDCTVNFLKFPQVLIEAVHGQRLMVLFLSQIDWPGFRKAMHLRQCKAMLWPPLSLSGSGSILGLSCKCYLVELCQSYRNDTQALSVLCNNQRSENEWGSTSIGWRVRDVSETVCMCSDTERSWMLSDSKSAVMIISRCRFSYVHFSYRHVCIY
jgi:hypothetical protein